MKESMDTKIHKTAGPQTEGETQTQAGEAHTAEAKPGVSSDANNEQQAEQLTASVEREAVKLEQNLEMFRSLVAELSPQQDTFISERIAASPEGKTLLARVQSKAHELIHSYEHTKDHLSNHYDPRLVKVVGGVGKAIGGFTGFLAGHGVMSAPGSVAGSKAGGYAMLKVFEELAQYLPADIHEKIRVPKSVETQNPVISENEAKISAALETKGNLLTQLGEVTDEIAALPEDQKEALAEVLTRDEAKITATVTKVQETYTKYRDAFKRFEKKHPIVATSAEVLIHWGISPVLESFALGETVVHALEVLASTGGAETLTTHIVGAAHHVQELLHEAREKMSKYDLLGGAEAPQEAAA
jgi:hypothetical protein